MVSRAPAKSLGHRACLCRHRTLASSPSKLHLRRPTAMDFETGFQLRPVNPINSEAYKPTPERPNPLGPLASLAGTWKGNGFNTIWRPHQVGLPGEPPRQDRFLELNLTSETL